MYVYQVMYLHRIVYDCRGRNENHSSYFPENLGKSSLDKRTLNDSDASEILDDACDGSVES